MLLTFPKYSEPIEVIADNQNTEFVYHSQNTIQPITPLGGAKTFVLAYKGHDWLERLAGCESSHREDIVVLDTNKRYSYGCLQFQKRTWDYYTTRYGVYLDIMNCQHQKELASMMLQESHLNYRHWLNCSRKIGLP
jgi:hypothetical protein